MTAPPARPPTDVSPDTARLRGVTRRPTGSAPPLPRTLGTSGKVWLALAALAVVGMVWVAVRGQPPVVVQAEADFLQAVAALRTDWLTPFMRALSAAGGGWTVTILGSAIIVLLLVFKRWRHLFTFLLSLPAAGILSTGVYLLMARPRPLGVEIIGRWSGYSMPSLTMVVLAGCLIAIAYAFVPAGRPRSTAKWVIGGVLAVVAAARLYLAVDHPSDIVWGVVFGVTIPLVAFRWFTPNEVFPVTYRRGKTAHLDVSGARGEAIRRAIADQLGLTVLEVKPIGLEASGGSTPLRLKVAGDPDTYVFAKLYAKSHVRADRWYKLGRTILYGSLEDESSFESVRRFVQYEDYALRVLRDAGVEAPAPYGVVEITPQREYLIVMEFFEGAVEISDASIDPVDESVIDQGLQLVRKLWNAGLAHRDLKPGNLMVRDGRLLLVDAFFVQVRPSPWRQAVDLGNMMLVLAVKTDPERVYRHALRYFTPSEIAEAFAATRGVASPTQLRTMVKKDGRDLLAQFRRLAPERKPIGLQRWSVRRVALALAVLAVFAGAIGFSALLLTPLRDPDLVRSPTCRTQNVTVLMAQAVPSATVVPCIATVPAGWTFEAAWARDGRTWFRLGYEQGAFVVVTLTRRCDTTGARTFPTDEPGTGRLDAAAPDAATASGTPDRFYRFPGGCITYDFAFPAEDRVRLTDNVDEALDVLPRSRLVAFVEARDGLPLCGAGASCPG